MGLSSNQKERIKLFIFVAFTLQVAFLDLKYLILLLVCVLFYICIVERRIKNYFKNIYFLYIFSLFLILLDGLFYNSDKEKLFSFLSKDGLVVGIRTSLKMICISSLAYIYKLHTSYYKISCMFYTQNRKFALLRGFSLMIILVFMFLKRAKKAIYNYNLSFNLRRISRFLHPLRYTVNLFVYLLRDLFAFAQDVSLSLENRLYW